MIFKFKVAFKMKMDLMKYLSVQLIKKEYFQNLYHNP